MRRLLLACALLLSLGRGHAAAGLDLTAEFVSEYVFRGQSQRQGASIQSSLGYNVLGTLNASLWTNLRLENGIALTETDYALRWTWLNATPAALTLGGVYYDRSRSLVYPETAELFAGLDFDVPGHPSLYLWYDVNANTGAYYELTVGHRFLLPGYRSTIDLGGGLGFDSGRVNGFNDARISVAFTRHLGEWRLKPSLDFHFPSNAVDPGANGFTPVFRFSASRSF